MGEVHLNVLRGSTQTQWMKSGVSETRCQPSTENNLLFFMKKS